MKFIPKAPRQGINVSPTHPLKEALYLVLAVSAGAAVIFAVVISIIDFAVVLIPPTVERDAFEKVWPHWQTLLAQEQLARFTTRRRIGVVVGHRLQLFSRRVAFAERFERASQAQPRRCL